MAGDFFCTQAVRYSRIAAFNTKSGGYPKQAQGGSQTSRDGSAEQQDRQGAVAARRIKKARDPGQGLAAPGQLVYRLRDPEPKPGNRRPLWTRYGPPSLSNRASRISSQVSSARGAMPRSSVTRSS